MDLIRFEVVARKLFLMGHRSSGGAWWGQCPGLCGHHGHEGQSSRCLLAPLASKECFLMVLHVLTAMSGVHHGQMTVCDQVGGTKGMWHPCPLWPPWAQRAKCQVLASSSGGQRFPPEGDVSAHCHWWCAPWLNASVQPAGGSRGKHHLWLLWPPWAQRAKWQVLD